MTTMMLKICSLISLFLLACNSIAAAQDVTAMLPEWTVPKKEGDRVPDVTFFTRSRIETDDPNPFDWKCTNAKLTTSIYAELTVIS